ncbi:hypothetical protein PUN28_004135 [Cardiocondyla obscurior]|uniref:Uncharacterized protein n=1 Tax=Cardiocondyla obscurior TaxID=286306 RepID=A0AAW2GPR9_9HYME
MRRRMESKRRGNARCFLRKLREKQASQAIYTNTAVDETSAESDDTNLSHRKICENLNSYQIYDSYIMQNDRIINTAVIVNRASSYVYGNRKTWRKYVTVVRNTRGSHESLMHRFAKHRRHALEIISSETEVSRARSYIRNRHRGTIILRHTRDIIRDAKPPRAKASSTSDRHEINARSGIRDTR